MSTTKAVVIHHKEESLSLFSTHLWPDFHFREWRLRWLSCRSEGFHTSDSGPRHICVTLFIFLRSLRDNFQLCLWKCASFNISMVCKNVNVFIVAFGLPIETLNAALPVWIKSKCHNDNKQRKKSAPQKSYVESLSQNKYKEIMDHHSK